MDDTHPDEDENDSAANSNTLEALKQYIVRVCLALINKDSLDSVKLREALERQDALDILRRFLSSAESSIVFLEDSSSVGGEGNWNTYSLLVTKADSKIIKTTILTM